MSTTASRRHVALGLAAVGLVVVLAGVWIAVRPGLDEAARPAPRVTGAAEPLDDLLANLQLIPLDGQLAPPFTLEGLDGKPWALGDLNGRPALLYFWAAW